MDLVEAHDRLDQDIQAKAIEHERLRAELAALSSELTELNESKRTLELLMRRYGGAEGARPALSAPRQEESSGLPEGWEVIPEDDWSFLQRTEAVERALREAGGPMRLEEIVDLLGTKNRSGDSVKYVSAALAHMKKRTGSVNQVYRGVWTYIPPDRRTPTAPEEAPETDAPQHVAPNLRSSLQTPDLDGFRVRRFPPKTFPAATST